MHPFRAETLGDCLTEELNESISDGHANHIRTFSSCSSFKQCSKRLSLCIPNQMQLFKKISKKINKNLVPDFKLAFNYKVEYEDGIYSGQFLNKKRHGLGVMKFFKRFKYFGEWKDDQINGFGFLDMNDKGKYLGEFKNNAFHGKGTFSAGKDYYTGEWKKNLKHGVGKERCEDVYYEGFFKKGQKHGKGLIKSPDFKIQGVFKDNQLIHGSSEMLNLHCKYEGEFQELKTHGEGRILFSNKSDSKIRVVSGIFANGELTLGRAKLTESRKSVKIASKSN